VFILKELKVVCFDTLLQVLILKVVSREAYGPFSVWNGRVNPHAAGTPKTPVLSLGKG